MSATVDAAAARAGAAVNGVCPACGTPGMEIFHRQDGVPVNSCLLLADRDEAQRFPTGELRLGFCATCGFIANTAFDPSLTEYSTRYEETQGFSPRFRAFAQELAARWVDTYELRGRTVLEIGCGKGEFLVDMMEAGAGRGVGIDPSCIPERTGGAAAERITWIQDFYSPRYSYLEADAVVCRHTLEHIPDVADFMRLVRRGIGERSDTIVLFEVPDVVRVLRETAFWDVYYEHCSYFGLGSLARLFRATGFEVIDLRMEYDDQYLVIEAVPGPVPAPGSPFPLEEDPEDLRGDVEHFRRTFDEKLTQWREDLASLTARGGRAVIWGAGSKGVAYLTGLGQDGGTAYGGIEYAVDINPFKHGMYLAGTGHRIVAPDFLREYRPDLVIAMNAIYRDEIARDLEAMGVEAELATV